MPLYRYACQDCGEELEILHPVGNNPDRCALDCKRRDAGPFGQGRVDMLPSAPHIARGPRGEPEQPGAATGAGNASPSASREALRRKALEHLGSGQVTEQELDRLRDGGMTVYRRSQKGRWEKDGGDAKAPAVIAPEGEK